MKDPMSMEVDTGKILDFLNKVYNGFWFSILCLAAIYVCVNFVNETFFKENPSPMEIYLLVISSIGLTTTLAGLAFAASNNCKDEKKRDEYFKNSEGLLLAVVMFVFILMLRYMATNLPFTSLSSAGSVVNLINVVQAFLFVGAAIITVNALQGLHLTITGALRNK